MAYRKFEILNSRREMTSIQNRPRINQLSVKHQSDLGTKLFRRHDSL